ncbi:MAG: hypothetical protein U9O98_05600 [Asgard group archaeon]|nr:hypothetical protein [Asgard group archaeon]
MLKLIPLAISDNDHKTKPVAKSWFNLFEGFFLRNKKLNTAEIIPVMIQEIEVNKLNVVIISIAQKLLANSIFKYQLKIRNISNNY